MFSIFKSRPSFDKPKMKSRLKMSVTRIQMKKVKVTNSVKIQKRQIAKLLAEEKDESARIKVEAVIRDEFLVEAMEIIEMFLELCSARIQLIAESKTCPHDMKEAISTIIYVASRLDVQELLEVRRMLAAKWGKKFVQDALANKDLAVNPKVMLKMGIKVPEPQLCIHYLKAIAKEFDVEWEESNLLDSTLIPNIGQGHVQQEQLQPMLKNLKQQQQQQMFQQQQTQFQPNFNFTQPQNMNVQPPQTFQNPNPNNTGMMKPIQPNPTIQPPQTQPESKEEKVEDSNPNPSFDFDALQKRFEELKKGDE